VRGRRDGLFGLGRLVVLCSGEGVAGAEVVSRKAGVLCWWYTFGPLSRVLALIVNKGSDISRRKRVYENNTQYEQLRR
jgi:hypothetical protein